MLEASTNRDERAALNTAIENAQQIIAAAKKL
jgi:hypothetical protein